MVVLSTMVVIGQPAHAAPGRADGKRVTLLVHGFDREADVNCAGGWSSAKDLLNANGWANVYTFGYYNGATNCDLRVDGTTDTRIQEVGRQLAWTVYYFWSSGGVAIDIMAHSMGGLVSRAAIEGVRRYGVASVSSADLPQGKSLADVSTMAWPSGWPPYLYIEDIVTLATPHKGISGVLEACALTHEQCSDMREGSGFLSWLGGLKSSAMGTDYTLLGSGYDDTVSGESAVKSWDNDVSHAAVYYKAADGDTISHTEMRSEKATAFDAVWHNLGDTGTGYYSPPLIQGMYGLYNHMLY
ncbi:hypothetical protein [Nonomuraea rosea]